MKFLAVLYYYMCASGHADQGVQPSLNAAERDVGSGKMPSLYARRLLCHPINFSYLEWLIVG